MLTQKETVDRLAVEIYSSRDSMGAAAAGSVSEWIREVAEEKDFISMIFAAAPSQDEMLACLARMEGIPWNRIRAFHMDEYIGLAPDAPQGFGNFLRERLFGVVPFASVDYIDSQAEDPAGECRRYAELLAKNPPDIVCMGIGENGHIAFNDPDVALFDDPEAVKVVKLDHMCRMQQVNDGCFAAIGDVPETAITLTIPTLVSPRYIACVVPGSLKAEAVRRTLKEAVSESCPASILRNTDNAVLFLDMDSSSKL